ncbi:transcription termination factor NusA [Microscilla marina]|uniref:Transcription termination/antitermination protein NusA n=1 Tax=Microscilla marina ATCC 23134 TaxID=313606 RepID=A1ZEG2_MICM2|nr:transcription termination factor NusA [Microscilla marina]EAY31470.1 transcription termination factor NusA [Microscilla marina ATCC 23134]
MDKQEIISSFAEFARAKNIDKVLMEQVLEEVFRTMIRKKYTSDENFDVIVNIEDGDLEMYRNRIIVEDDSPEAQELDKVTLSEAKKIDPEIAEEDIGDEFPQTVYLSDFGRRAILTARQTLIQKIKDVEKENLYLKYKDMTDEIVVTEVHQILSRELLLLDSEGNELSLPKNELIPKDRYRKGEMSKAVVHRVDMINGNPKIILSRTSPIFLERLFESEIPEVYDGLITIKKVVRQPGERAKVAVESYDDRIDPVGACVGMKGSRIHSIVRELNNENIDVINYTDNLDLYITRALSPAKITSIKMEDDGRVSVFLKPDQVSLAIGKGGHNIKLASKLVGMEIDVYRDMDEYEIEEDIELSEFDDEEIEPWIRDELRRLGMETAKSVLNVGRELLINRSELEEETVDYLLALLKREFEEEEEQE